MPGDFIGGNQSESPTRKVEDWPARHNSQLVFPQQAVAAP